MEVGKLYKLRVKKYGGTYVYSDISTEVVLRLTEHQVFLFLGTDPSTDLATDALMEQGYSWIKILVDSQRYRGWFDPTCMEIIEVK